MEPFAAPRRIEKRLEAFGVELGKGEPSVWALHCSIEILNKVVMEQQLSIDKMWGFLVARQSPLASTKCSTFLEYLMAQTFTSIEGAKLPPCSLASVGPLLPSIGWGYSEILWNENL
ncbi:MAG: hypothetical protein FWG75_07165 [Cystobacterineae bacterium]|nr:hypothetical protein [Cystobacterineae bacterium]